MISQEKTGFNTKFRRFHKFPGWLAKLAMFSDEKHCLGINVIMRMVNNKIKILGQHLSKTRVFTPTKIYNRLILVFGSRNHVSRTLSTRLAIRVSLGIISEEGNLRALDTISPSRAGTKHSLTPP